MPYSGPDQLADAEPYRPPDSSSDSYPDRFPDHPAADDRQAVVQPYTDTH
jgi:hypothetical protein